MKKSALNSKKAAFLLENGFCEAEFMFAYTLLREHGVDCRIIAPNDGMLRGWNELPLPSASNWGQEYAPDTIISQAQPADYDMLVIPGGKRSIEKLKLSDNIKTFLSGFVMTAKPVLLFNAANEMVDYLGFHVAKAGASRLFHANGNILSVYSYSGNADAICNAIIKIVAPLQSSNVLSNHKAA